MNLDIDFYYFNSRFCFSNVGSSSLFLIPLLLGCHKNEFPVAETVAPCVSQGDQQEQRPSHGTPGKSQRLLEYGLSVWSPQGIMTHSSWELWTCWADLQSPWIPDLQDYSESLFFASSTEHIKDLQEDRVPKEETKSLALVFLLYNIRVLVGSLESSCLISLSMKQVESKNCLWLHG